MNAASLEKKAEAALEYLHKGAQEHGVMRAQADHLEDFIKVELSRLKNEMHHDSDAAKTAAAMRHPDYQKALEALKTAREVWYYHLYKREAAHATLDCWRTACSNERANV